MFNKNSQSLWHAVGSHVQGAKFPYCPGVDPWECLLRTLELLQWKTVHNGEELTGPLSLVLQALLQKQQAGLQSTDEEAGLDDQPGIDW